MFRKNLWRNALQVLIIFMVFGLIFSPIALCQNWTGLPPYNTLWPLWSHVLSLADTTTGIILPIVTSLTPATALPVQPGLTWNPGVSYPWLFYNTPLDMIYFDETFGLNTRPAFGLLTPLTSTALQISLSADFAAFPPLLSAFMAQPIPRATTEVVPSVLTATDLIITNDAPKAHPQSQNPMLRMAFIEAKSIGEVKKLARMGLDIAAIRKGPVVENEQGIPIQTYRVEAVLSARNESRLDAEDFNWSELPGKGPVKRIGEPYNFYHSFDEPVHGIKDQLRRINSKYPKIIRLKVIGLSVQHRPILAVGLTNEKIRGDKPQVLFVVTHHAREWITTEMAMRLIKYLASNYGSDARVTNLLDTTEVWIIPVANPDGYQFTFTNERLWRKNLRDNDGDGQITLSDGVDLNRNFDSHWGYDEEGSSSNESSGIYRGSGPNSEPETQAVIDFIQSNDFKFILSYHSFQGLIAYPWGFQKSTPSLDDPIFVAQAGTDDNPAVWDSLLNTGYDIGLLADLYIINGDFVDWCYYRAGVPAQMIELTFGEDAEGNHYGFEFPDDDSQIQTVFEDNLEFALCYAESAINPSHPVSPVGIATEDIYHTPLTASYGSNQIIQVLACKGLDMTLYYGINSDPEQTAGFVEKLGTTYNENPGVYYNRYQAVITGQSAGDTVTYRIVGGTTEIGPYNYSVINASDNPILVVAAEDYNGLYPVYPSPGPHYLVYYTDALDAGSYAYDIWDVDVHEAPPSYIEVLSHYDVAIWYTGDDYVPTVPGIGVHEEEFLNFRDFINYENGKLFSTGQGLAMLSAVFGEFPDDFFQYYLGAYMHIEGGGMDSASHQPFAVMGVDGDPIFGGLAFQIFGGDGANNQHHADTFLLTSHFVPHFSNTLAARYDRPGGPFDPHSGSYFVYSQIADMAYKRLGGTFMLPSGSPSLRFWISYDIEPYWDYAFVEISEEGTDMWTTLPDMNGLTTTNTGDSCSEAEGWVSIHPFLAHYMDANCNPEGTTGSWNAFTANSGGWQQVEMDLSAYAGITVELHISYASDWAFQALGVFIDDIEISGMPIEDFEAGMGEWTVSTAPGSSASNNWIHTTGGSLPEGPAIRTPNSVYLGFGFEAIDTAENRNSVMDNVMQYLGL